MANLYAIAENLATVLEMAGDDGSMPPDLECLLDSLEVDLRAKIDGICRFIRSLETDAERYGTEIKRLQAIKSAATNKAERLENYVEECLRKVGLRKLDTDLFKLSICKNSRPSIALAPDAAIPAEYLVTTLSFNSQAAYEDWKAGAKLPDTILVHQGEHLRIR